MVLRLLAAAVALSSVAADLPDGIGASVDGEEGKFKQITPEEKANMLFLQAVNAGDLDGMSQALEDGADIDAVHKVSAEASVPAIMMASLAGNVEVLQYLLDEGADAENPDSYGFTPIHGVAFKGHPECASLLLEHGVDAEVAHEQDGNFPIHRACWKNPSQGHVDVLKVLVEAGIDPNLPNRDGMRCMDLTYTWNVEKLLHESGGRRTPGTCRDQQAICAQLWNNNGAEMFRSSTCGATMADVKSSPNINTDGTEIGDDLDDVEFFRVCSCMCDAVLNGEPVVPPGAPPKTESAESSSDLGDSDSCEEDERCSDLPEIMGTKSVKRTFTAKKCKTKLSSLIDNGPEVPMIEMCPCSCAQGAAEAKKAKDKRKDKKKKQASAYEL